MRILFVADGRSPTTLSWIKYWIQDGNEVHLVSTFPCDPIAGLASLQTITVALSGFPRSNAIGNNYLIPQLRSLFRIIRYYFGPLSVLSTQHKFKNHLDRVKPDIVHALRIPFEGMLSCVTPPGIPYVISTWGNDLTLHAVGSKYMGFFTRKCLKRADAIISDTRRDIHLSVDYGFRRSSQQLVLPGGGGIDTASLKRAIEVTNFPYELPTGSLIVNPRGHRPGSIRQDLFFEAIPKVLTERPDAVFIFPGFKDDKLVYTWMEQIGISKNVLLLPRLEQYHLWYLFSRSQIYATPSLHDGLPNSLLEAMACGCFPVVGAIDSMREWIDEGKNGLLVDASDPNSIARGIIDALKNHALRSQAREYNRNLIAERANYLANMEKVKEMYLGLANL